MASIPCSNKYEWMAYIHEYHSTHHHSVPRRVYPEYFSLRRRTWMDWIYPVGHPCCSVDIRVYRQCHSNDRGNQCTYGWSRRRLCTQRKRIRIRKCIWNKSVDETWEFNSSTYRYRLHGGISRTKTNNSTTSFTKL